MANKYMKRCSPLGTREMQISITMRYQFTPDMMTILKKKKRKISIGKNVENLEPLSIAGVASIESILAVPAYVKHRIAI